MSMVGYLRITKITTLSQLHFNLTHSNDLLGVFSPYKAFPLKALPQNPNQSGGTVTANAKRTPRTRHQLQRVQRESWASPRKLQDFQMFGSCGN